MSTDSKMCAVVEAACDSRSEVACASDWESGLIFLKEQHRDIMVLDDMSLSGQDCSGLTDLLGIIVHTGSKQLENWVRLKKAGAVDVVPRPTGSEEVRRTMGKTLAHDKTHLGKKRKIPVLTLPKKKEQIPAFVKNIIRRIARELGDRDVRFTAGAIHVLIQYAIVHGLQKLEDGIASAIILKPSDVIQPEYLQDLLDKTALISRIHQVTNDRVWDKCDPEGELREYRRKMR